MKILELRPIPRKKISENEVNVGVGVGNRTSVRSFFVATEHFFRDQKMVRKLFSVPEIVSSINRLISSDPKRKSEILRRPHVGGCGLETRGLRFDAQI